MFISSVPQRSMGGFYLFIQTLLIPMLPTFSRILPLLLVYPHITLIGQRSLLSGLEESGPSSDFCAPEAVCFASAAHQHCHILQKRFSNERCVCTQLRMEESPLPQGIMVSVLPPQAKTLRSLTQVYKTRSSETCLNHLFAFKQNPLPCLVFGIQDLIYLFTQLNPCCHPVESPPPIPPI